MEGEKKVTVVKQTQQRKLKHTDKWKRCAIWPIIAELDTLKKTKLLKV